MSFLRLNLRPLLLVSLITLAMSCHAQKFDPQKVSWSTLKYSASKLFISLHARVDMQIISPEQVLNEMIPIPEKMPKNLGVGRTAATEQVVKLRLATEYFGTNAVMNVWMDTDTDLLQRRAVYTGRKNWQRTTRFTPNGAYSIKTQPQNESETQQKWQQWPVTKEKFYTFGPDKAGLAISETEALFYIVGTATLNKPGDRLTFYVFDKDEIIDVNLIAKEWNTIKTQFKQITGAQSTIVDTDIKALRIELKAVSHSGNKEADINFLGYDSDINIFVDTERKIILEITGKADYLGTVNIHLDEAVLSPHSITAPQRMKENTT